MIFCIMSKKNSDKTKDVVIWNVTLACVTGLIEIFQLITNYHVNRITLFAHLNLPTKYIFEKDSKLTPNVNYCTTFLV